MDLFGQQLQQGDAQTQNRTTNFEFFRRRSSRRRLSKEEGCVVHRGVVNVKE
jgi:hypothetical protein